ncbi:MAG: hypothetical protein ACM3ML_16560 [Micromonosporaceae bacterium]
MDGRRLFDAYVAVDWSARDSPSPRRPSRDSVWFAHRAVDREITATVYARTREECFGQLRNLLVAHAENGQRVFVGFDFPFGFPSGFAAALGLEPAGAHAAWRHIWDELSLLIADHPDNHNNRFDAAASLNRRCGGERPGPLWGYPAGAARPGLTAKSPRFPYAAGQGSRLERLRWTERRQPGTQPVWKLFGAGSVGSQCLMGIPYVRRLRFDPELGTVSRVWPFETGFADAWGHGTPDAGARTGGPGRARTEGPGRARTEGPGRARTSPPPPQGEPFILYAEIWPSMAPGRDPAAPIRDEDQVRAMVTWLRSLDDRGWMDGLLRTPPALPAHALHDVLAEEGWIAGTR